MAATDTQVSICNNALSLLKSGLQIVDFNNDQTQAAKACRQFYVLARDEAFGDYAWNFTTNTIALTLVATNPTTKWAFSYQYPSDCIMFRRILPIVQVMNIDPNSTIPSNTLFATGDITSPKVDTAQSLVEFEIQSGLIYTDAQNAVAEYTQRNTSESTWPVKFVVGFSFMLAAYLAPRLTDGDPWNLHEKYYAKAQQKLAEAKAHSGNERAILRPESEFTRVR